MHEKTFPFAFFFVLFLLDRRTVSAGDEASAPGRDPEVDLGPEGIVRRWGYPSERHVVSTADGYLLSVFRVPHGRNARRGSNRRPSVFLQHGLLAASTNWITNLPNESLAFILADAGFDVWMGNMRGNTYSRNHTHLDPKSEAYWSFSWDEMAAYDLPAMIDHVLNVTGWSSLYYVGHSQGTAIVFAQASRNPQFAAKIKHFFALGPVAELGHMNSKPLRLLSNLEPLLDVFFKIFGVKDFFPNDEIIKYLAEGLCTRETRIFCSNLLFILCGYDAQQLNSTRLPVYFTHTPAGTSVKNIAHFAQMVRHGKFQMYDYGSRFFNWLHYNQTTPPLYDVTKVRIPTSVYWGGHDLMADPTDVQNSVINRLSNVDDVFISAFDHLDFIWALDAADLVYKQIATKIKLMTFDEFEFI